jgi:PAS domain S-box-containing protein
MTEDLIQNVQVLSDIISASPVGIAIYDDSGQCISTNDSLARIIGATKQQVLNQNYNNIEAWKESGLLDTARKVVSTNSPIRREVITISSFGKKVFLDCHAVPFGKKGLLFMAQDITERKQMEEKLSQSERFLNNIIDQNPHPIWISDAKGTLIRINRACCALLNIEEEDVIYKYNILKDDIVIEQGYLPLVQSVFNEGEIVNFTITYDSSRVEHLDLSGTANVILEVTISPVKDESDIITNAIVMHRDITKNKILEKQLLQSQKMEAIGQLTGGIAHDFNNMLSVIMGHAELLKSSLPQGDPLLKNVLEIENAALHSRDITRQLLAFSRKQIVAPKTTNLNKSIVKTTKTLAKLIGEHIDLRFYPQQDLWHVRIDPAQVDQILFNLSANARDAMPNGGTLTIKTSHADIDEIYCSFHVECQPGQYVVLSVNDDGVGMDNEMLSHVFEPFYTTKEVGKGTGLGLATVYGITRQNGGFITAYSEPGKGSTFNVHIPRLMDEVQEEEVVEKSLLEFHPATVLLVEDDDMVRRMTAEILKRIGYSVVLAEDSTEALTVFEKETSSIDLLITDVIMPQMSGAELVSKIKKIKPELKVLFMSGYAEDVILRQGVLKEGIHFVQKPFSMNDFARKVRDAIEDK